MALIPIAQPNAPAQVQQRERKSAIDDVLKGLAAANQAFGIAVNYRQFQDLGLNIDKKEADADYLKNELANTQSPTSVSAREDYARTRGGAIDNNLSARDVSQLLPGAQLAASAETGRQTLERNVENEAAKSRISEAKNKIDLEDKLVKERLDHPITKGTHTITTAFSSGQEAYNSALEAIKTGKSTLAADNKLIYANIHTLDEGARVTDGDYDNAVKIPGIPAQIIQYLNQNLKQQSLLPEQREALLSQIRDRHATQQKRQDKIDEFFAKKAIRRELDPEHVLGGNPYEGDPYNKSGQNSSANQTVRVIDKETGQTGKMPIEEYERALKTGAIEPVGK